MTPPDVVKQPSTEDGPPPCGSSPAAVLIIDAHGYLPMSEDAAALFQISRRYQKGSVHPHHQPQRRILGRHLLEGSTIAAAMAPGPGAPQKRGVHHHGRQLPAPLLPGTSPKTPTERRPPLDSQNAPRVGNFADQLWVISVIAITPVGHETAWWKSSRSTAEEPGLLESAVEWPLSGAVPAPDGGVGLFTLDGGSSVADGVGFVG